MSPIGNTFIFLESVDSTNNYAMAQIHAGLAKHGDAYFSPEQTAGKGQRNKEWNSGVGENIALSCILQPSFIHLENQFLLSMTIALGCYDFVNHFTKSKTRIKWPNDIYWCDRKAGGILIENTIKGNIWQYAVAGVGININQVHFPDFLSNPVSLKQVTGESYDIILLAKKLCNYLQARWLSLITLSRQQILEEYNSVLYKKDERIVLKQENKRFETIVKGVSPEGQLITFRTREEIFNWSDVEWVI